MDEKTLKRFEKFVDISGDCWVWNGRKDKGGYGKFGFDCKDWLAHRVMYLHCHGYLTPGLMICHTCRNKCVNPDHLEEKTSKENQADRPRDGTDSCGEKQGASKLTAKQVLEIRSRANENRIKLAEEFGISYPNLNHIIARNSWKHI